MINVSRSSSRSWMNHRPASWPMAGLGKRMAEPPEKTKKVVHAKKRFLKKEDSEVTMASDGFPAMLATQSDSEGAGSAAESSAAESSPTA